MNLSSVPLRLAAFYFVQAILPPSPGYILSISKIITNLNIKLLSLDKMLLENLLGMEGVSCLCCTRLIFKIGLI